MNRRRILGFVAVAALAAGGIVGRRIFAQDAPPRPAPAAAPRQEAPAPPKGAGSNLGGDLVAALKESPGCLGVDSGQLQSGKLAIFAWFKDKAALVEWYYSDAHQDAMEGMLAGMKAQQQAAAKPEAPASEPAKESTHTPLEFVADGTGPILCVATITPSQGQAVPGFPMPIGQISIELYQPLPGGASFNGTFAPPSMPIEHHHGDRTVKPVKPVKPAKQVEPPAPAAPAEPKKSTAPKGG